MAAGEFDKGAFEREVFTDRTREVAAPLMADWFKGGDPVFVVRGLTFDESIRCEALASQARAEAAEALASLALEQASGDAVKNIRDALGWGDATQPMTRVSIEKVMIALVSPKLSRPIVAKIARDCAPVFGDLLAAVRELTNGGREVEKKLQPSGQKKASKQA